MKCVISGVHIKVFARAIHSLARIGDELFVEPSAQGVSFHTVNSSRSAFASFLFGVNFFSQFDGGGGSDSSAAAGSSSRANDTLPSSSQQQQELETIKCKVAMKAFLSAFKSLSSVEKNIERCKVTLDGAASRLLLQMSCRNSVVRSYNLAFIECETLKAVFDESACLHRITGQSRLLSDVFVNFQPGQDEVSMAVGPSATTIRNYVDDEPDLSRVIRTELLLEGDEFDEYQIDGNCEVVFCLKELRALLGFSEPVNLPVTAVFSQPGSPIIFSVENKPLYECKFVLATLVSPNMDSQVTTTAAVSTTASATNRTSAKRTKSMEQGGGHHTIAHHNNAAGDSVPKERTSLGAAGAPLTPSAAKAAAGTESLSGTVINRRTSNTNGRTLLANRRSSSLVGVNNETDKSSIDEQGRANLSSVQEVAEGPRHMTDQSSNNSNSKLLVSRRLSKCASTVVVHSDDDDLLEVAAAGAGGDADVTLCNINGDELACSTSPPHKRRRHHFLFKRCFNSTYDPTTMPGYDVILARDSDAED